VRYSTVQSTFDAAPVGSGVLILGGEDETDVLRLHASKKNLKVFVELPLKSGAIKRIEWERVIVTGDQFGMALPKGSILSISRQPISVHEAANPLLAIGRVAGFDRLAFGLPTHIDPLLWMRDENTMVAAAPLTAFSTARFAPSKAWKPVIQAVVSWLGAPNLAHAFSWEPEVHPVYGLNERLPSRVESQTAQRAASWFTQSHLILKDPDEAIYLKADQWNDRVGPAPAGGGNGTLGIMEGYSSAINGSGNQMVRYYRRADCNAESAMALSLAGNPQQKEIGGNIADFIALKSEVLHRDPERSSFGLVGWNDLPNNRGTFYGDDNARYILGLIGAAGALRQSKWDDQILRCILANFRTSGRNGFRGDAIGEGELERLGWKHFYDSPLVNMAPHFEAYLWALYLWAYQKTGFIPLLDRTEKAIERVVSSGENAWTWTNGSQQERARMLLPLSWLIRVDDTPVHREWLQKMAYEVIRYQVPCGAIREEFGDLSHGIAGPPRTNEAFGTGETPLIQENGDPLADMLYTSNFAFLGLHEAAEATKGPVIRRAEDQLAKFLCRIQIQSKTHPELSGAWFRAFDFGDWDYWASNADLGWGAWSIETGWSVSWITTILALRQRHIAFWDVHPGFKTNLGILKQMLPSG
jgi:hypothetical protein